jgi:hypothetical protein
MGTSAAEFIEAWVSESITIARYEPSHGGARARELAQWLRADAAAYRFSNAAGFYGSRLHKRGYALTAYIAEATAIIANSAVTNPEAKRVPNEDF